MKVVVDNHNIVICDVRDFNLEQTLECGQCFHFKKLGKDDYGLSAFGKLLHISQFQNTVTLYQTTEEEYDKIWKKYFDLERDYSEIKEFLLAKDNQLKVAMETMSGVRILQQDFFETLISFIISQNKQIPHIKQIVSVISERFGRYLGEINGESFYAFPSSEEMKNLTLYDLKECKTGFRAPYIIDAIEKVNAKVVCEEQLRMQNTDQCEQNLRIIKGVGEKIANCVMLFGLEKRDAFPIDVWIKRIMEHLYFEKEVSKEEIAIFAKQRYGMYGGYAQQYLFYYGRETKLGVTSKKKVMYQKKKRENKR